MTLLREVMERPLDPGYQHAHDHPKPRTRRREALTLLLAVTGGYLLSVSVGYVRQPPLQATQTVNRLRAEVAARTADLARREATNAELRARLAQRQRAALTAAGAAELADQAERLGTITGELPVIGAGLEFTITDAPNARQQALGGDPRAAAAAQGGIVLDSDLQVIVNGLWQAGAEAITINGERLTALSAIRSAGQAILVDFRPLAPPYLVDAIGDPSAMQSRFAAASAGAWVQSMRNNNGIRVDVAARQRLSLHGAGQLVLRSARPEPAATAAAPSATAAGTVGTGGPAGRGSRTPGSPASGSHASGGPASGPVGGTP